VRHFLKKASKFHDKSVAKGGDGSVVCIIIAQSVSMQLSFEYLGCFRHAVIQIACLSATYTTWPFTPEKYTTQLKVEDKKQITLYTKTFTEECVYQSTRIYHHCVCINSQ